MKLKNYLSEANLAVLEVVAIGLILLVTAFQIYGMVRPYDGPQQPEINASYDAEENLLKLNVVNGSFTESGSREVSLAFNDFRESNTTFTIHGYGENKKHELLGDRRPPNAEPRRHHTFPDTGR